MKRFLWLLLFTAPLAAAAGQPFPAQEILRQVAEGSVPLWGIRFEPDLLIVSPATKRMVVIRHLGSEISRDTTTLPPDIPAANSVADYEGRRYVTLVGDWLGSDRQALLELTAHESFHFYQDRLGVEAVTSDNAHLDTPEGRAFLHLEFDALRRALKGSRSGLKKALQIRWERRRMFPDNNEAAFEKHEGSAQYTGLRIAIADEQQLRRELRRALRYDLEKGYANSFAYATGPAYASLLDRLAPDWRSCIAETEDLSEVAAKAVEAPAASATEIVSGRRYARYLKAEQEAEDDPARYLGRLTPGADVLRIPNDGIGITFNPNDRMLPLADKAVLLRNVTLRGRWGTLTARQGLVRMNDWSAFIAAAPRHTTGDKTTGDDYQLVLLPGWDLRRTPTGWCIVPATEDKTPRP